MDLILAYGAGLLTLINPCVLPVLPIVLASALSADRRGPFALALGMSISFVALGMIVATFGRSIGLTEETLSRTGAIIMIAFGLVLLVPAFGRRFETATAGFAARADAQIGTGPQTGVQSQFFGGLLLGAVWSPCIGPTLGGAIALASQGENLIWAGLIMVAFAAGVSTLILGLAVGTREGLRSRANALRGLAAKSKPIMGVVFLAVGLMILTGVNKMIDIWALDNLPYWLTDLSVAI